MLQKFRALIQSERREEVLNKLAGDKMEEKKMNRNFVLSRRREKRLKMRVSENFWIFRYATDKVNCD
jgi:hypothetical protein